MLDYIALGVSIAFGVITILNTISIYKLYRYAKHYIGVAMKVLQPKSVEARAETARAKDIDEAVGNILEGVVTDNPALNFARQLITKYTDLEVTPENMLALAEHPLVKRFLGGDLGQKALGTITGEMQDKGKTKYRLKGGIVAD